ncbi:hypothetical protein ACFL1N_12355 [Thermodesulfobacteriota bacterium]
MNKKLANKQNIELDDDAKMIISEIFQEKIIPRLNRLGARIGTVNCGFAGPKYSNWNIRFKSAGSDFYIDDFEYDEEGASIDLDL